MRRRASPLPGALRLMCAALVAASLIAARPAAAPALEGDYSSVVTRIGVKLTQRLSSQDARTGDIFTFDTSASVAVDGVFLPAGTHGRGVVRLARSARGPEPGALDLAATSLDLPDKRVLAVALESGQLDRKLERAGRAASGRGSGSTIYLGGDGSTNVVYEKGTEFIVVTPPPETPDPQASAG